MQNKRVYKINFKVNDFEKEELGLLMQEKNLSLSDIIRLAIKNYYNSDNFSLSYESTDIYNYKRKSIYDKR